MPFTQRAKLAERVTELCDQWWYDVHTVSGGTRLGPFITDALIAEGWIFPEITQAEADGVVASILAIE